MSNYATKVEQARSEILKLIRSWDGYETNTGPILDALDGAAEELLREKAKRWPKGTAEVVSGPWTGRGEIAEKR